MNTGAPAALIRPNTSLPAIFWTWMAAPLPHPEAAAPSDDPDAHDRACMERMVTGDTQALRPVFDRWKLPLLSYFYRALGSRADAEDLALQTFERVFRKAHRYRPGAKFSSWLFAIARGELLHELRRRRRKSVVPVPPEDLEGIDAPPADAAETEEMLLLALQSLPERQRSAVVLAAAGDLDLPAIAQTLGVSLNHLHVILHRARLALRTRFNQLNP